MSYNRSPLISLLQCTLRGKTGNLHLSLNNIPKYKSKYLLEDEQGADYDDDDLLDALADIIIDRQEKV